MRVFTFLVRQLLSTLRATRAAWRLRVAFCLCLGAVSAAGAGDWIPLARDGVHDPRSPGTKQLQQPRDALTHLTPDSVGNQVRWVQALDKSEIQPREKIFPQTEVRKLDRDVILNVNGSMPAVRFPHRQHTEWLDCKNCHEGIFSYQKGETDISMFKILQGEQCGICHGAVAFPLTECTRCHSIPRDGASQPVIPAGAKELLHHLPARPAR